MGNNSESKIYISPVLVLIKFPVLNNETFFWSIPLPRLVMFQMMFTSKTTVYNRFFFYFVFKLMFLVVMFFILYFGTYMRRLPLESTRQAIPDELLSLVGKLQKVFSCGGWCSCEDRAASLAQKGGQIRGKEGAEAGEPWDLTMSNLGSTGSWKGSVSPAVFITQCCWTQGTHFVSELHCTERAVSLSPVGVFCTRYASVLQTFSAVTAALTHLCCWVSVQSLGFPGVASHENRSRVSVCVQGAVGSGSRSHGCTLVMACHEKEHVAECVSVKSRGVHTAAWTSWASLLGGMRHKCVSERGAGFGGTDWQGGWNRSFLEANTSFHFCLPVFCQEAFAVSRSWWLQPAVLKLSIHRLTVQCRRVIYLMCTYLLQSPSNRLPFPSSPHSVNLFTVFSTKAKSLMTSKMQYFQLKHFVRLSFKGYGQYWKRCHAVLFTVQSKIPECTESLWLLFCF